MEWIITINNGNNYFLQHKKKMLTQIKTQWAVEKLIRQCGINKLLIFEGTNAIKVKTIKISCKRINHTKKEQRRMNFIRITLSEAQKGAIHNKFLGSIFPEFQIIEPTCRERKKHTKKGWNKITVIITPSSHCPFSSHPKSTVRELRMLSAIVCARNCFPFSEIPHPEVFQKHSRKERKRGKRMKKQINKQTIK